jgi:hypothetical protein
MLSRLLSTRNTVRRGIPTATLCYWLQRLKSQQTSAFSPMRRVSLTRRVWNSQEQDAEIESNIHRKQNMMKYLFTPDLLFQLEYFGVWKTPTGRMTLSVTVSVQTVVESRLIIFAAVCLFNIRGNFIHSYKTNSHIWSRGMVLDK